NRRHARQRRPDAAARVRGRQRQDLARVAAGDRRQARAAGSDHRRATARLEAGEVGMATIRALVAVDSSLERDAVQAALPAIDQIEITGVIYGLDESWNALQEAPTDLVVVACKGYSDRTLFFIGGIVKQRPDRPIVVMVADAESGFVRRVFEAGADDVVVLPETPQRVAFAFQKALARRQGAAVASGVALAPMVCVLGPKGGTGKTLIACNLAVALAGMGKKVALVDLDLQFGDVGLALGLSPEKTIYDLAKPGGSPDIEKLDPYR